MPIKEQSKKSLRQSIKRAAGNLEVREDIKTLIKKIRKAIGSKESKEKIEQMLKQAQKAMTKAAQKNIMKKNTAARKLSRLMKYFKQGGTPAKKEVKEKEDKENK